MDGSLVHDLVSLEQDEQGKTSPGQEQRDATMLGIISALGAQLVSLGLVLFIGANWNAIPAVVKAAIVIVGMLACYASGWYWRFEVRTRPKVGEALTLLGVLLYGGAIWLVAQLYHCQLELPSALLLWSIGAVATALATSSGAIGILSVSLLGYWLFLEPVTFNIFAFWLAACLVVSYTLRSPWALGKTLIASVFWMVEKAETGSIGLAFLGLIMFLPYIWHAAAPRPSSMARPYLYLGPLCILLSILALTDGDNWGWLANHNVLAIGIAQILLCLGLAVTFRLPSARAEWIGLVAATIGFSLLEFTNDHGVKFALANIVAISVLFSLLVTGMYRLKSPVVVTMVLTCLVAYVTMRYFDEELIALQRSFFFISGGTILLLFAYVLEPAKAKLQMISSNLNNKRSANIKLGTR